MKINNKGAIALLLILIISSLLLSLILLLNFQPNIFDKQDINLKKAYLGAELGIDDGLYLFNQDKDIFFKNLNGCKRINGSIPIKYEYKENGDLFKINTNFSENLDYINNNNYSNNNGFTNRICSIYEKSYPYDGNEDYVISIKDKIINGVNNNNGMYYIKKMDRDENIGFIFTKDTLKDENGNNISNDKLNFKLVFNILNSKELDYFGGIDYLKTTEKYKEIVSLMQSKGLDITKSSLMSYFGKDISNIFNDAKVEIGLVEYDGSYSSSEKNFIINSISQPKVIKRNLCNGNGTSGIKYCEINLNSIGDTIKNGKLYFVYYKTYDKGTTTIFEIQDGSDPVYFITGDLHISLYGNSNNILVKNNYIKNGVVGNNLASGIFNYLYYSQN